MTIPSKYHFPLLALACLLLFFTHLDVLYENIMEARNFITAREMANDGNWILTTMNGEPRYEKPPLPTWLAAISGGVFGFDKIWALRLPSAMITSLMVLFFYRLARKISGNREQAFNGSLILASSFYILFSGRNGTWDIFAHSFMLVGIYYSFRFFTEAKQHYKHALFAGLGIGLSFMSKGPVSHFALLLPFLIAYATTYKWKTISRRVTPFILMLIVIIALSAWWAVDIYLLDTHAATTMADKEATAWAEHNTRHFFYYWSFFTQSGIWTIPAFIGLLYPYLKDRVQNKKAYTFSLIWTLAAVVLLSLIPEKKSRYLLPTLIPLALNTSFYFQYLFRSFKALTSKWETWPVYFNFGLIMAITLVTPLLGIAYLGGKINGHWFWYLAFAIALLTIGIVMFRQFKPKNIKNLFYLTILFVCAIVALGFPLVKMSYTNTDYARLSPKVAELDQQEIPQYLFNNSSPELIWDLGQRLPLIQSDDAQIFPEATRFMVWVDEDNRESLKTYFNDFRVTQQERVDGNKTFKADRNYKARRVAYLFSVERL